MSKIIVKIPDDWPFEHMPTWEYDEDGDLEVTNYECGECKYFGSKCKCIDHSYVHFSRPWFSSDTLTSHHSICKAFEPDWAKFPAGCLEWDALGGFDEWYRLWRKQWHNNRRQPWGSIGLNRAKQIEGREHSDDVYCVSYDDFLNCNIIGRAGIYCIDYRHIERSKVSPSCITGYKWIYEGSGLWIPWEDNKYIRDANK